METTIGRKEHKRWTIPIGRTEPVGDYTYISVAMRLEALFNKALSEGAESLSVTWVNRPGDLPDDHAFHIKGTREKS